MSRQAEAVLPPQDLSPGPSPLAPMLAITAVLLSLGLVMVFSTSWLGLKGEARDPTFFFRRQVTWALVSVLGLVFCWSFDYRKLARLIPWALAGCLLLLVGVLIPGVGQPVRNVWRWIRVGGVQVQPSEMAKLLLPLGLAVYLAQREKLELLRDTVPSLLAIGLTCALIAAAPDFGTALFVGGLSVLVLFVGGVPMRQLVTLGTPALALGSLVMFSKFSHIQWRILAWLAPEQHLDGAGYQPYQSLIALGSGGWSGRGLGAGHQKFLYLPDAHTDFIFAVLGEELGFVGTLFVVLLFAGMLYLGYRIVRETTDKLGFLMAFAVVFALCFQAAVNMAVVTSSVPTKGISMPFLSFGGSSLFFSMLGLGVLLNIATVSRRTRRRWAREAQEAAQQAVVPPVEACAAA